MKLNIETPTGAQDIEIMSSPETVTRSQYIDFVKPIEVWAEQDIKRAIEAARETGEHGAQGEGHEKEEELDNDNAAVRVTPFKYFCSVVMQGGESLEMAEATLKALQVLTRGDLSHVAFHDPKDDLLEFFENGVDLFEQNELTLCKLLLFYLVQFRNMAETLPRIGEGWQVEYKGEAFTVHQTTADNMASASFGRKAAKQTVLAMMEISEFERLYLPKVVNGDNEGIEQFKMEMAIMAILLRKPSEALPHDRERRRAFISERALHFKQLPLSVFLQVDFFLRTTFLQSAATQVTKHISAKARNFRPSARGARMVPIRKPSATQSRPGK